MPVPSNSSATPVSSPSPPAALSRRPARVVHMVTRMEVGGVQKCILALLAHADRARFEPSVICLTKPGEWADRVSRMGFELHDFRRGRWDVGEVWRLQRLLRRVRPDLLHIHGAPQVIPAATAALWAGAGRYVIHHHNSYERHLASQGALGRWWERRLTRRAGALLACSPSVAAFARQRYGLPDELVAHLPYGLGDEHFTAAAGTDPRAEWNLPDETPLVVQVSRYSGQKRIEEFIEAAALALRRWPAGRPAPVFVALGSGPEEMKKRYERLIGELELGGRVILAGVRDDVASLLPWAQVGVLATNYEGSPLALLEYMAAGLPVVATNLAATVENVREGETGYVYPLGRADALAERIVRLLLDPALARRMGELGRQRARRYSWPATVAQLETIYGRLLA